MKEEYFPPVAIRVEMETSALICGSDDSFDVVNPFDGHDEIIIN